jgi:glutathione-specific gamma-glutamylcyclotransferase
VSEATAGDVWVFGYGSLIWRPSFPFVTRRRAAIAGFARRLWQGSDDHRGVPGALGRVATLIPVTTARCVGVAFLIAARDRDEVLAHLDHREKNGYERHEVALYDDEGAVFARGVTFVAGERNPNFLGDAPLDSIVRQVERAHGPSGANREYVLELARALHALDARDEHIDQIARALAPRVFAGAINTSP